MWEQRVVRQLVCLRSGTDRRPPPGHRISVQANARTRASCSRPPFLESADWQIHRVVVETMSTPTGGSFLEQPIDDAVVRPWMALDILLFIRLRAAFCVLAPAGVDKQNILHVHPRLASMSSGRNIPRSSSISLRSTMMRAIHPIERDLVDGLPGSDEMARRIQCVPM